MNSACTGTRKDSHCSVVDRYSSSVINTKVMSPIHEHLSFEVKAFFFFFFALFSFSGCNVPSTALGHVGTVREREGREITARRRERELHALTRARARAHTHTHTHTHTQNNPEKHTHTHTHTHTQQS